MARIAGVDIPNQKRVEIALTYIYGIGRKSANDILAKTGINPDTRAKDLTEDEIAKLRDEIERNYHVEGDLRREVSMNIKNLVEINCYTGIRHRKLNLIPAYLVTKQDRSFAGVFDGIINKVGYDLCQPHLITTHDIGRQVRNHTERDFSRYFDTNRNDQFFT